MKRSLSSCDSMCGLMAICPNSTDENNPIYSREFQTMLEGLDDEGGCIEESGHVSEKKRRLSIDQVKSLEKNFEVENKLEPERKIKLAQELGLQPRQVAVWFQNRRARWKTKQLERDYGVLKANYDGLKLNFDKLEHDNQSLLKQIRELKSKMGEDGNGREKQCVETEAVAEKSGEEDPANKNIGEMSVFGDFKDGSSDSDSSAILNEHNDNNSPTAAAASTKFSSTDLQLSDAQYQPQLVKIEEHNFFGEESCTTSFFSDDQAPTLHWYCDDEWN